MRSRAVRHLAFAAFALLALSAAPAAADEPAPAPPSAPATAGTQLNTMPPGSAPLIPVVPPAAPPGMAPFPPPGVPFSAPRPVPRWGATLGSEAAAQHRQKRRLLLAGAILFGLGYYGSLAASSVGISQGGRNSREYIPGLFPIVGPFVTVGLRADPNSSPFGGPPPSGDFAGVSLYLALGAVQLVGAGLLIAGLRMPAIQTPAPCSERLNAAHPCPPVRLSFTPVVSPSFAGGGLTGQF